MSADYRSEEWRPMLGRESEYAVSSLGRVICRRFGNFLLGRISERGYRRGHIGGRQHRVHRLVFEAFTGPLGVREINHKNGVKTDNRLENLEVATRSENLRHAYRVLGRKVLSGSKHHNAKLDELQAVEIIRRRRSGEKLVPLAAEFGVSASLISRLGLGEGWKHVRNFSYGGKASGDVTSQPKPMDPQ